MVLHGVRDSLCLKIGLEIRRQNFAKHYASLIRKCKTPLKGLNAQRKWSVKKNAVFMEPLIL